MPGATPVLLFMAGLFTWSMTYAIYWVSPASARIFWLNATYFGVVAAPGAFFAFTLLHTGRQHWIRGGRAGLLIIQPVITLLLLWTDPLHGLFYAGRQTPDSSVIFDGGPWFWIHIVYSYGLLLISVLLLGQAMLRAHAVFRKQAALVLFAALLPWLSNIVSLTGLNPLDGLDLTPISFALTGLIIAYSLYRTALLDLVPVARSQIVDELSEAVIVVDVQQRIVDTNFSANALITHLNPVLTSAPIGLQVEDVLPAWRRWIDRERPVEYTVPGFGTGGADVTMRVTMSPLLDGRGARQGQVILLTDISAEKRLEHDLRESLVYFQALFDSSTDALFICDAQTGAVLDINARASEIYGFSRQEMLGSSEVDQFSAGIEPYTREKALERFRQARISGSQAFEWMGRTKANTLIWLDMHIRYVRLGDEDRYLIRVSDITERKRAQEREFELALERERSSILSHFVRDASHEFMTPLSSLQMGLYLLSRTDNPDRRIDRTIQMEQQIRRISRLVEMLVTLSQLDSGVSLDRQPVDINQLVRRVATEAHLEQTKLRLVHELAPNLRLQLLDPDWMHEALRQLIDNAIRFTPDGGAITLVTRERDRHLVIDVRDTGHGISPENQERIFDRFFRLDDAHTSPGFGLGLPIARRIIELHGGCISVSSALEGGSTFSVSIPISDAGPAALTETTAQQFDA